MAVELPEQSKLKDIKAESKEAKNVPALRDMVSDLANEVLELKKKLDRLGALEDERFR